MNCGPANALRQPGGCSNCAASVSPGQQAIFLTGPSGGRMYLYYKVLQGVVEVYYAYLKDLDSTRLFCGHDQSFTCMHVVYALITLDISKMDPGSYKEALDNMGKLFIQEVKHMLRREKTFASRQQQPLSKKIREQNK